MSDALHRPVPDPDSIDPAQIRAIRRLLTGIFLILMFTATYFARDLLLPLVLAVLIVMMLSPVVRTLERRGISPPVTAVALIVVIAVLLAVTSYLLSGPVSRMVREAPAISAEIRWKLRDILDQVALLRDMANKMGTIDGDLAQPAQQVVVAGGGMLDGVASSVAKAGSSLFAALILSVFVLSSGGFFVRRMVEAVPRLTDKKRALTIVRDVERQISRYLGSIALINAMLGLAIGTGLWLIGMPYAYLWGIGAFLLNFVPFLGAVMGTTMVAGLALITFDSVGHALLAPLIYFFCTSIEGQFITPTLVGRRLELNTSAVFITVVLWVWLWGVPGAFLAVPILVLVKVICDNIDGMHAFGLFIGVDPAKMQHPD